MAACVRARRGERRGGALSRVAPLDVAEWWVRVHEPKLAHVTQAHMLLASGVLG